MVDEQDVPVTLQLFSSTVGAFAAETCPTGIHNVFAMETIVMNLTAAEPNLHPAIRFHSNDQLALIPTSLLIPSSASSSSSSQNTANNNNKLELLCEKYTPTQGDDSTLLFASIEHYGIGFANYYLTLPSLRSDTNYTFCYKGEYDTRYRTILNKGSITANNNNNNNVISNVDTSSADVLAEIVNVANPNGFTTSPPVILPTSTEVIISITG